MPVATPKNSKETGSSMKKSKKTPMKEATPMKSAKKASKENVTPSNKKVAKAKPSGLVLEHSDNLPDKKALAEFVKAMMKVNKMVSKDGKQLFEEDGVPLHLIINGIKLPRDDRKHVLKVRLPHCVVQPPRDVCLIVKDLKKGLREDHEDSVNHFKDLVEEKGVTNELVNEVIALRQLKVEYKQYESKLSLVKRYDIFLADSRVIRLLPKFLGKPFYARKKFPIPVDLRANDLKEEVTRALHTVTLPLAHHGTTSRLIFGNTKMSEEDVTENLAAALEIIGARYPGGAKNIRSLNIKTESSLAIPIHINTASGNDLGFVDASIPAKMSRETVTGELSTQPGMEITVTPAGTIKVKKTGDPLWDDEKDEPFISGSEEEEEDEEAEADKNNKEEANNKKRKMESVSDDKNKKTKTAKKAKKGGNDSESEEDSEDEDIKQNEKAFMKRAQKEDEAGEDKPTKKAKKAKEEVVEDKKKLKKEGAKEEAVEAKSSQKTKKSTEEAAVEEKPSKKKAAEAEKSTKKQKKPVDEKPTKKQKKAAEKAESESSDEEEAAPPAKKPKQKVTNKNEEKKKKIQDDEEEEEWEDVESDEAQEDESGDEVSDDEDEVSELEFTDGSDDDDDDDDEDSDGSERITEVFDDEQELDPKDVIVDSDDDSDEEESGDDQIMLDSKLKNQAEASDSEEDEKPKKAKKLSKNERRKQRNEEKNASKQPAKKQAGKPQQENKTPSSNKKPPQKPTGNNKKPPQKPTGSNKKPVPAKPASAAKSKQSKKR